MMHGAAFSRPESLEQRIVVAVAQGVSAQAAAHGIPFLPHSFAGHVITRAVNELKALPSERLTALSLTDTGLVHAVTTSFNTTMGQLSESQQRALKEGRDPYGAAGQGGGAAAGGEFFRQDAFGRIGWDRKTGAAGGTYASNGNGGSSYGYAGMSSRWDPSTGGAGLNSNNFKGTPFDHAGLDLGTTKSLFSKGFNQQQIIAAAGDVKNLGFSPKDKAAVEDHAIIRKFAKNPDEINDHLKGFRDSLLHNEEYQGLVHQLQQAKTEWASSRGGLVTYFSHILVIIGIYLPLAYSLNLVLGFGGLISFCHAAFYGLGAYVYALLVMKSPLPVMLALIASVGLTATIAALIGLVALRFRSDLFLFVTLAFQMIVFIVLYNWVGLTGGPYGIAGIPRPALLGFTMTSNWGFVALAVAMNAVLLPLLFRLYGSHFGLILKSVRENEVAAESLGINSKSVLLKAFVIAASIAALPGAFYASYVTFIDPTSFALNESIYLVSMLLLGGSGNRLGPLIGVVGMTLLPELLRFLGLPEPLPNNRFFAAALRCEGELQAKSRREDFQRVRLAQRGEFRRGGAPAFADPGPGT